METMFRDMNLKAATQKYNYTVSNRTIANENVYAILQGPRADATEAIVLLAAWRNMADEVNNSAVALIISLAAYFKRWSLWSKDIIFVIPGDSTTGSQAWVDAYHEEHDERFVQGLKIKSGALQGAVALDYPVGPWGHRYDKLHIVYDGTNGQQPNLDLFNTAVSIASGHMGIDCIIQNVWNRDDSYKERLQTMLRGMLSQGLGHATGPHSAFIPYHVDAISLVTVGDGWHDEMALGKVVESLVRSLNNILEHLHQSFFFYLLLSAKHFVSIGTYLPSAMLIAVNFSISAMALWFKSGQPSKPIPNPALTAPKDKLSENIPSTDVKFAEKKQEISKEEEVVKDPPMTIVKDGADIAIVPTAAITVTERQLLIPLSSVLAVHFLGVVPLFLFNYWDADHLHALFITTANVTSVLPFVASIVFHHFECFRQQDITLMQCFSLLFLGMFLAALATLNFSLSFLIGVLTTPLSFVRRTDKSWLNGAQMVVLVLLNPVMAAQLGTWLLGGDLAQVLVKAAQGWHIWGQWTQLVVWLVWFPAWAVGSIAVVTPVLE